MPDPLQPHELYELLAADLDTFAAENSALFSRASDPFHVLELLAEAPGKFRIIATWMGEEPAPGTSYKSGIVRHRFNITVTMNRGLPLLRGSHVTIPRVEGDKPLLQRVAEVRDRVRSFVFSAPEDQTTERLAEYGGCEPVTYDGAQLDAFQLSFYLRAAMTRNTPRT